MLCDPHRAVVMGHDFQSQLKATMSSPDIRGYFFTNCCAFS
jgi:UDP-N-acetylglucosamine 1-carboxyvinyltransferase